MVLQPPSYAYAKAREALEFRFGSRTLIIETNIKQLTDGPPLKPNDSDALYDLATKLRNCYVILSNWQAQDSLDSQCYLADIFNRLPHHLQLDFAHEACRHGPTPKFLHLMEFVENRAYMFNSFYGRLLSRGPGSKSAKSNVKYTTSKLSKTYSTLTEPAAKEVPKSEVIKSKNPEESSESENTKETNFACSYCQGDNNIYRCNSFSNLNPSKRREFVESSKLCFNCLGVGHLVKQCKSSFSCRSCGGWHHSLLHIPRSDSCTNETKRSSGETAKENIRNVWCCF